MKATIDRVKRLLGNEPIAGTAKYSNLPLKHRLPLVYKQRTIGVLDLVPGYNNGWPGGNYTWRRPRARFDPMVLPAWARGVELISNSVASAEREYKGDAKWVRIMLLPNARVSEHEFWRLTMYYLLNFGNAFWIITDNGLYSRHPATLDFNEMRDINNEDGKMTYHFRNGYNSETFTEDDVLHFKANADNPYIAMSPTQRHGLLLDGIQDAMEFGIKFFKNAAVAQGIITMPENDDMPLDNEMLKEFKQSWNDQYQGDNAHGIAIAPAGTEYHAMQVDPKKAQMLDTQVHYIKVIAQLLGLQPYQLADTSASTYNNLQNANYSFIHTTVKPWIDNLADQLYLRTGVRMTFDLTQLLAGSRSEEINIDLQMVKAGVMTADEFRVKHVL